VLRHWHDLLDIFITEIYSSSIVQLLIKLRFSSRRHRWPYPILAILYRVFGFIAPKILKYLAFQAFDFERTWWRLFQKRVVCTKFDIYVFIDNFDTRLRIWWCYITRKHYNLISILPEWSTTYLSSTLLSENKISICTIIYGRMVLPMYSSYLPRDESALWYIFVKDNSRLICHMTWCGHRASLFLTL